MKSHQLLTVINDAEKLYDVGLKRNFENGTFECPVCQKSYVRESAAIKHLEERNCLDMAVLFTGTVTELSAYEVYVSLTNEVNPNARVSIGIFRKSPVYNTVMKFVVFMMVNHVAHLRDLYLAWIIESKSTKFTAQTIKYAMEMKNLDAFKLDLQKYDWLDHKDMEQLFQREKDNIENSPQRLVRLVETGHLTMKFLANHDDPIIEYAINNLPIEYESRLLEIASKIV